MSYTRKYKLFPNAISSPQSNISDNFSQNEKKKVTKTVDIV